MNLSILGKYHFRIYTSACGTSWYIFDFKIHSKAEGSFDDNDGQMPEDNVDDDVEEKDDEEDEPTPRQPQESVAAVKPSALRQHVIDITKQWEGKTMTSCCKFIFYFRLEARDKHGQLVFVRAIVFDTVKNGAVLSRHCARQQSAQPSRRDFLKEASQVNSSGFESCICFPPPWNCCRIVDGRQCSQHVVHGRRHTQVIRSASNWKV